jgi:elongation factor P
MAFTYETSDLRKGLKILIDNAPYIVVEAQFVKPGKGAPFTRTKMKNLLSGGVIERNIRSGEKLDGADVEDKDCSYLYKEGDDTFVFMDSASYEQYAVPSSTVDDSWQFLKENLNLSLTFYNGRVITVNLPNFVEMRVMETEPGVRGDTATGASKAAKIETGASINVPLFIVEGDILKIDTRTGDYIERAGRA